MRARREGGRRTPTMAVLRQGKRTYLGLCGRVLIVAVGGGAERGTGAVGTGTDTAALGQVLLALLLPDLDLLLLATAAQLLGLECVLGLELGPTMLGNVAFRHGCGVDGEQSGGGCSCGWRRETRGGCFGGAGGQQPGGRGKIWRRATRTGRWSWLARKGQPRVEKAVMEESAGRKDAGCSLVFTERIWSQKTCTTLQRK